MTGNGRLTGLTLMLVLLIAAAPAAAYAGPGAGLSMIGSLVALVGAVLAGIFGFVWFPVKRMLKKRKANETPPAGPNDAQR